MRFRPSLEFLTAIEASPPDLAAMAHENELDLVSLPVVSPRDGIGWNLIGDTPERRATKAALRENGVGVDVIEAFYIRADTDIAAWRPAMESGAELGAKRIVMVHQLPDEALLLEKAAAFCEQADEFGLAPILEYTPRMTQKTFAQAKEFVARLGRPELTIEADSLHTARGGTPLSALAENHALISRAQICDGPATIGPEDGLHEAINERMVPGEGQLPLVDFLRSLPDGIVMGLEVPMQSRQQAGHDARRRVRDVVQGYRRVLEQAGQNNITKPRRSE